MKPQIHISLDGHWKMRVVHHQRYKAMGCEPVTFDEVAAPGAIDAVVPGNFELDMERAGLIPDPFFGMNALTMQRYEDAHVFYARKFAFHGEPDTAPELVFEGLDTLARIFLNGKLIGETDNMFIVHTLPACGLLNGENELVIHLSPVCIEARKHPVSAGNTALRYNYETLRLRKAPHMFAWDIMPRLVSAGIYRPVGIYNRPQASFSQVYLYTCHVDPARHTAALELFYDADIGDGPIAGYAVRVEGGCGDSKFASESRAWFTAGKIRIPVTDARLWWPRGCGAPALYDVTVSLLKDGAVCDARKFRLGIRVVALVRTSITDSLMSGDFHFEVNGKRVFVQGTNWVPVDAYHSRDRERIPRIMALLDDIGVNAVRVWGGNLYEDDVFYDACDAMGILVWQDFAMACGSYPIAPDFQEVIRGEATAAVRRLRQHPALMLWSGDNECDQFIKHSSFRDDPNKNRLTREVLTDVVYAEDPTRPYLPSSPYMDEVAAKLPDQYLTENHLWGPRDYFKSAFYKGSLCNFASEMGYHGCPSVKSIEKFISKDKLWP